MNLDKSRQLFFGCKIDSKLREALAQATPGDRRYFEEPDSEFLRICTVGENERWIGKVADCGLNTTQIEDIQRNVVSILRRIASGVRIAPSSVKVFAIASESPESAKSDDGSRDVPSSRGEPYIANY